MTETVGQMTPSELSDLIENILERKLLELLADPDKGLELNHALVERLQHQDKLVSSGEKGLPLEAVRRQLLDE